MKQVFFALSCLAMIMLMTVLPVVFAVTTTYAYSVNWSGYVATAPTPFTSVSASWIVPSVTAASSPAFSSVWVGVGGFYRNSNKLIQAGTEQVVISSTETDYLVWYEVYPKAAVTVGTINPGELISVVISENAGNPPKWHITITDTSNSTTLLDIDVKAKTNFAAEASAEFIVERPLLVLGHQITPLAHFTDTTFSSCTAGDIGLNSLDNATAITMTGDGTGTGTTLASPSILSGDSFTVTWSAAS